MKIVWLGHGSFRIEIAGSVLLVDPWISGNPVFPADHRAEAVAGATHILVTHGHADHSSDAVALSKELGAPVAGIYDLMTWWAETEKIETVGFNKGGTAMLGEVAVTMVGATHSSSIPGPDGRPVYAGAEAGYMIAGEGRTIYFSGDTDAMADMAVFQDLHRPDVGILAAGGHFTMDMRRAAYAAKKFFDFKVVIPSHYGTFPLLEQSADALVEALPGVEVRAPDVMEAIDL